jgi:nicotinate-nucleotide adenylyltransferase
MLELLIKSAFWHHPQLRPDQLKIERYELEHPGPSYSYLTLQALAGQYPEHMFKWLIGSDLVSNFHKWYHAQELLQHFSVLVYPRQNFPAEPLLPGMTLLESVDPVAISSTQVRKRLAAGLAISDLVDTEVERYIRSNHLYGI